MASPQFQPKSKLSYPGCYVFVLLLLLVVADSAAGQSGYHIDQIKFVGNETIDDGDLREIMVLKTASWFSRFFLGKDRSDFDESSLANDLIRIRRFYQQRGFLNVWVSMDDIESNNKEESVKLTIRIIENAPILNDDIAYSFSTTAVDTAALTNIIPKDQIRDQIPRGERFRDDVVTGVRAGLMDAFSNSGYPYVEVEAKLDVDTTARLADINFYIDPGPLSFFGEITVVGRDRVGEQLIRNQVRFEQGERYSQKLLRESQQRIFALQVFEVVTVRAQLSQSGDNIIPIQINVSEAAQWSSKVGVGYGREDQFRAFTEMQLLSFMGGARRLVLYAKHSGLEPYHVNLSAIQPSFISPKNELSINPFIRRQDEPGYDIKRFGSHFTLSRRFNLFLTGSATYTFEQVRHDTTNIAEQEAVDLSDLELYNKSGIQFTFIWDDSSPAFSPDRGWFGTINLKYSGLDLGSRFRYAKMLFDVRRYFQLGATALAVRAKIGGIKSFDSEEFIPVEDRFFSGGSTSNRGWARGELGPLDDEGRPLGGNSLFEGNVELRYPIISIFSGVIFYDFANVWPPSYDYRFGDLRYAAGMGLRVRTPIGPVRADVARPVFDEETTIQFHISVGQAF